MVWVDSPKFFYEFSRILMDAMKALVDTELSVLAYGRYCQDPQY